MAHLTGEFVPEGGDIDLLVLSHSDADQIGEVKTILAHHPVRLILRTDHVRETANWGNTNQAIADAAARCAPIVNLRTMSIGASTTFSLEPAEVNRLPDPNDWSRAADRPLSIAEQAEFVRLGVAVWSHDLVWDDGKLIGVRRELYVDDPVTGLTTYMGQEPSA